MKQKLTALLLLGAIALSGCQPADFGQANSAEPAPAQQSAAEGAPEQPEDSRAEEVQPETDAPALQETAAGAQSEPGVASPEVTSAVATLPFFSTVDELIAAYIQDYNRAAEALGLDTRYTSFDYYEDMATAIIDMGNLMLLIDTPYTMKRIWYVGTPQSEEWMRQHMQIVMMAVDNTLSEEEAKAHVTDIYQRAKDNDGYAVNGETPNGMGYSLSVNERGGISFYVILVDGEASY